MGESNSKTNTYSSSKQPDTMTYPYNPQQPGAYPQQNANPPQYPGAYPQQNVVSGGYYQQNAAPPPYSAQPVQYAQQPYYPQAMAPPGYQPNPQNIVVQGLFDADARFGNISQATIPPPPPGCAPNAAQIAMAQGHNVVGTQQSQNWVTGSQGGGYSFGL